MVVVELIKFNIKKDLNENDFLSSSDAIKNDMSSIKGFIKRELIKSEDGMYADLVHWESMEDAKGAMDVAMKMDSIMQYFSFIDESSIDMNHFEVIQNF